VSDPDYITLKMKLLLGRSLLDVECGTKMKYVWAVKLASRKQESSRLGRQRAYSYFPEGSVYVLLFRETVIYKLLKFK
jgi:hypothetical protein